MYTKKNYVHEIAAVNLSKIYFLKNAKYATQTTRIYIAIELILLNYNINYFG